MNIAFLDVAAPDVAGAGAGVAAVAAETEMRVTALGHQTVGTGPGRVARAFHAQPRREQRIEFVAVAFEPIADQHDVAEVVGDEFQRDGEVVAAMHDLGQRHEGAGCFERVIADAFEFEPLVVAGDEKTQIANLRLPGRRPEDFVDDAVAQRNPQLARAEGGDHHVLGAGAPGGGDAGLSRSVIVMRHSSACAKIGIVGHAAVDVDGRAGHVTGCVGEQHHGHARDLADFAHTLQRDFFEQVAVLVGIAPNRFVDRRLHGARGQRHDTHAVHGRLLGHGSAHQRDGRLAGRVRSVTRPGDALVSAATPRSGEILCLFRESEEVDGVTALPPPAIQRTPPPRPTG